MTAEERTEAGESRQRLCVWCRRQVEVTCVVCPRDGQRTVLFEPGSDPRVGETIEGRFTICGAGWPPTSTT